MDWFQATASAVPKSSHHRGVEEKSREGILPPSPKREFCAAASCRHSHALTTHAHTRTHIRLRGALKPALRRVQGCIELLDRYDVQIAGRRAVVLGRSNIVGLPVSRLLMHRDATVTVAHSKTVDVASVVRKPSFCIASFSHSLK